MSKVTNIANKLKDSKARTPEQCVAECLDDIRSGAVKPVQLIVCFFEELEDDRLRPGYYVANMSRAEHISLLELAKARAIEDWRSG